MVGLLNLSRAIFELLFKSASGGMDFVARARFHIEKNMLNNMTLDDIAAESFVSPCYLSRAFKRVPVAGSPVTLPAAKSTSPNLFCNSAI
jgi:methylphosphotriester-DNA--protein-cysteine methyltransferase